MISSAVRVCWFLTFHLLFKASFPLGRSRRVLLYIKVSLDGFSIRTCLFGWVSLGRKEARAEKREGEGGMRRKDEVKRALVELLSRARSLATYF